MRTAIPLGSMPRIAEAVVTTESLTPACLMRRDSRSRMMPRGRTMRLVNLVTVLSEARSSDEMGLNVLDGKFGGIIVGADVFDFCVTFATGDEAAGEEMGAGAFDN